MTDHDHQWCATERNTLLRSIMGPDADARHRAVDTFLDLGYVYCDPDTPTEATEAVGLWCGTCGDVRCLRPLFDDRDRATGRVELWTIGPDEVADRMALGTFGTDQ